MTTLAKTMIQSLLLGDKISGAKLIAKGDNTFGLSFAPLRKDPNDKKRKKPLEAFVKAIRKITGKILVQKPVPDSYKMRVLRDRVVGVAPKYRNSKARHKNPITHDEWVQALKKYNTANGLSERDGYSIP